MPDDTPAAPALGFSITSNITDRSQIVVQSFVPLDASDEQINATLDKVMRACDRQRAKYQIKDFKLKLDLEEASLADQVAKLADFQNAASAEHVNGNRRGEFRLNPQQTAAVNNFRKTIESMKYNVERNRTSIAELEAMAK